MKTKHIILIWLSITAQFLFPQKVLFTKGTNCDSLGKKVPYTLYVVAGKTYKVFKSKHSYGLINSTGLISYFVGYDSLNPKRAKVYYNMPFFNNAQNYPVTTSGKIITASHSFCEFQFYSMDKLGRKKWKIAWQTISEEEIQKYHVKPGDCFNVQYIPQKPDASIIYLNQPASDNQINWQRPKLSKPNGLYTDFETNFLFTSPDKINQYLSGYKQPQITNVLPFFMFDIGWQYKSGISWNLGYGGASKLFMGKLGMGYLQQISRRIYINATLNFTNMSYSRPAFKNQQYQSLADTAQFTYTNWFCNPKIDVMYRISKNNSRSCSFLKVGAGFFYNLSPNRKWVYETGHTESGSKGGASTVYSNAADINAMPPFMNYMAYISAGIVFHVIRKP